MNTRLWFSPQLSVNIRGKIFLFQDRFNSSSLNSYRAEESKENLITCRPATQEQPQKPAKLSRLEVDSLKLRTESVLEAVWSAGDKPGQVTQIFHQVYETFLFFFAGEDRDQTSEAHRSRQR